MLDLIIPVYKNIAGLYRSLMSLGTELNTQIHVTIVDDCSGDNYDEIISIFQKFFPIRVIYLEKNSGPGVARQAGLDAASQPYVSFLDCGDVYISPNRLFECLNQVRSNPHIDLFSYTHLDEKYAPNNNYTYSEVGPENNRMHGKIYKRQFLVDHDIHFCAESSYANEDIGFNIATRLIAQEKANRTEQDTILHDFTPTVVWKVSGPSLVRSNDCAFYYKEQNLGMAINGEHIIRLAFKNGVSDDLILEEIYSEMVTMYVFYLSTQNCRPEFLEKTLNGAARYYHRCFKEVGTENLELLTKIYWSNLIPFLEDENDPLRSKMTILDFPGFLEMLENTPYT